MKGIIQCAKQNGCVTSVLVPILCIMSALFLLVACGKANSEDRVRQATHADDLWYPSTASKLTEVVDGYLANVKEPMTGNVTALISPHAGYRFCGQVMAYAYKQVKGMSFDTVVLIGSSHNYAFPGAAVYESGVFRNPLEDVEIDSEITKQLIKQNSAIKSDPKPHIPEHSLENQIPFLQRTLANFKIVPILIQDSSKQNCDMLSTALANVLKGKRVLLIASTDMTHYPVYNEAVKADKFTISALETMDSSVMRKRLDEYMKKGVTELHCMLCGDGPVYVVMDTAKKLGADSVKLLKYANSGDVPEGSKDRVVGYMAAAFYESEKSEQKASSNSMDAPLNKEQQEILLKLARDTINLYLKNGERIPFKTDDPRMKVKQGAFVTLRKQDNLRGCIGHIIPMEPLCDTVIDMAIASSTEDPRFRRVTPDEMKDIDIEISVLSVPRRVKSAEEIEMGKHGVIVTRGMRKGVFLPQVATETGWDRVTFLQHLCADKAGLSKDAWKDPDTILEVFTAQLFEEEK
jgi:AmmeMemoRadiSam system protein B/AmmeMemoRadiSam system protein A